MRTSYLKSLHFITHSPELCAFEDEIKKAIRTMNFIIFISVLRNDSYMMKVMQRYLSFLSCKILKSVYQFLNGF